MEDTTTLLVNLTVNVGDIEARTSAFRQQSQKQRERKISAKITELNTTREHLSLSIQELDEEFSSVWFALSQTPKICSKSNAKKALSHEQVRGFESQAELDLSLAIIAIVKAELSLLEAFDAALLADNKRQTTTK